MEQQEQEVKKRGASKERMDEIRKIALQKRAEIKKIKDAEKQKKLDEHNAKLKELDEKPPKDGPIKVKNGKATLEIDTSTTEEHLPPPKSSKVVKKKKVVYVSDTESEEVEDESESEEEIEYVKKVKPKKVVKPQKVKKDISQVENSILTAKIAKEELARRIQQDNYMQAFRSIFPGYQF